MKPGNETERLRALQRYAILDSPEEEPYANIAWLAAVSCGTPMALLEFVDGERAWLKARIGLEIRETPRAQAFGAHAILQPAELLVVNDTAADERFANNPLVTADPHIRYYAGAPLVTPEGYALGALAVCDRTARELSAARLQVLRALSRQVVALLEQRRELGELRAHAWQLEHDRRHIEAVKTELEAKSTTDTLTGVRNRRAFDLALAQEVARSERQGVPLSLLLIDIDRFRAFNKAYGPGAGDKTLQAVAALLAHGTRQFDLIARYEDAKFAVILTNTGEEDATNAGERLRRQVESAVWKPAGISVSVGVATCEGEVEPAQLLAEAEEALQQAKQAGRNLVRHASHAP